MKVDDVIIMSYELLTERELEVLNLLNSQGSNTQIADNLFVARSTVRFHIKNIYAKLGVSNRKEAVDRAHDLNLLSETTVETRHNLSTQLTPFIGRKQEIQDLTTLLRQSDNRLITILAPGGMGKTHLSIEVARGVLSEYEEGVFFVSLAAIDSADNLITTIADALDIRFPANIEPKQHLLNYLQQQQVLLILDNFENLLDGAPLVSEILKTASNVMVLATSRERLGLSGEKVYSVSGMTFPDWETPDDALEYDAVKLFMQGAQLASSGFQFHQDDLQYLARVCRLTEGMPLALTLASAWVDVETSPKRGLSS